MIAAILGHPFAGKRTLAAALAATLAMNVVDFEKVRATIHLGVSEETRRARATVERGLLLSDALFGEILWQSARPDNAIIVGRPRNLAEFESFQTASGHPLSVIHLEAGQHLIDMRMTAAGLPPSEIGHPGALARLGVALQPVLLRANDGGHLLTLSASRALEDLVEDARQFVLEQRALPR